MGRRSSLTPLQRHARKLYASMKKRIEEKRDKNGRIIRHGKPISFTENQLLEWLEEKFFKYSANGERVKFLCRYCLVPLSFYDAAYDHEIPLSRGGSPGLGNLLPICKEDNQFKGKLTPNEFITLRQILTLLPDEARRDIEGRLKKATKLAAGARWYIKKKAKETV